MDSETPSTEQQQTKPSLTLEDAHNELDALLEGSQVTEPQVAAIRHTLKEHVALREKVSKLKSLLGRSAKAQREAKVELEQCQRKLQHSQEQVEKLSTKVEKLASRPTHMDLLADFESNFDRAVLRKSVQQSGGQDTGATVSAAPALTEPTVDHMLLNELSECKSRMDSLETLNASYKQQAVLLEQQVSSLKREREHDAHQIKSLQLELRMAHLETEHATRALHDKTASLQEMQLEIDLVTKASVNASVRAAQEQQVSQSRAFTQQRVQELEKQVQALQEWALASAEAKSLAMEHVKVLERQLKEYQQESPVGNTLERVLQKKTGSLVIGAGDIGFKVLELGEDIAASLLLEERVVLRWKFDSTPSELTVMFSLLKGACDSPDKQARADYLIKDRYVVIVSPLCVWLFVTVILILTWRCSFLQSNNRTVTGGAAGETEAAFAVQNACTLLWSNESSWVRPRTIKYTIDIVAIKD